MTRLVRPYLSVDQVRVLVEAAEDRAFKMASELITHRQEGNRDPILLTGAVARLKEALAARERSPSLLPIGADRRSY